MKYPIYIAVLAATALTACSRKLAPADPKATKETVALFRSMWKLQQKGVMYGHQDDLMYGRTWWYEKDRSDTKDFTGDYPAVAGFELGDIELGNQRSLDSVDFMQIAEQIKAHYKRGGIITLSWHVNNPLTIKLPAADRKIKPTAWDVSSNKVVASILPSGENHVLFNAWLEKLASFFLGLKDEKGTPIPFIFRPYHEHSGDFFWWGTPLATDEQYAALWRYTVKFLRDQKGFHNILYAYNTDRTTSLQQYLKGYPGDDIIDMLSFDMYDRGPQFDAELDSALNYVTKTAIARKKLTALSETGPRRGMDNWWSAALLPVLSKYPVAYTLTWRHTYNPKAAASPNPPKPFPADFMDFYNSPKTLFLKDIQEVKVYRP
ncbi:MAG TPA: glycosyl hydrolase [Segetibacter sp.]|jgi:mannan endo-1,4-beta-mannosidase